MIEFPEALTIARQMNDEVNGKRVESSIYMDSPHKFAFYNRNHTPEEYEDILNGKTIGQVTGHGSWVLVSLEPGYMLKLGEGGQRILFHQSEDTLPEKHQLLLHFVDESYLTVSVQGWGLVALYDAIRETLKQAVELGGRDTERDLYNNLGGYPKILDRRKVGQPCPECGAPIKKIQYLGGSCYFCSSCQT